MEFALSNHVPNKVLIDEDRFKAIPDLGTVLENISRWEIKLRVARNQLPLAEEEFRELKEKLEERGEIPSEYKLEPSMDFYDDYLFYYFLEGVIKTLKWKIKTAKLELRWKRVIKNKGILKRLEEA